MSRQERYFDARAIRPHLIELAGQVPSFCAGALATLLALDVAAIFVSGPMRAALLLVGCVAGAGGLLVALATHRVIATDVREEARLLRHRRELQSLVERIRHFAQKQERFRFVTEMPEPAWQQWARENYYEVWLDWDKDFTEWDQLKRNVEFLPALELAYAGRGEEHRGVLKVMDQRYRMLNWARSNTTKEERARMRMERDTAVSLLQGLLDHRIQEAARQASGRQDVRAREDLDD
jgi:hypothetical protein